MISMLTVSCLTTGKDFPSDLSWLKKEKTSKEDVKLILGEPFAVGNSGGDKTWTYAFYKYKVFGPTIHKDLKIYWNGSGILKHFSFNSSFPEDISSTTPAVSNRTASKTK